MLTPMLLILCLCPLPPVHFLPYCLQTMLPSGFLLVWAISGTDFFPITVPVTSCHSAQVFPFFFFPNGNTWPLVPHHSILIPFPQLHVNNPFVMLSSKFFLNVLTGFVGELRKYEIQFLFCFSLFCSCIINPLSLI